MADRQCGEMFAPADEKSVGADHEAAGLQFEQPGEDRLEIALGAGTENLEVEPQRAGRRLEISRLDFGIGIGSVDERANGCRRRDHAVQQLQSLRLQLRAQCGHAREIAARSVQTGDEPESDRITADEEDDRNGRGRGFGRERPKDLIGRGDHGDLSTDQIGCQHRQPIVLLLRPAIFDRDIPALDIAGFSQALEEPTQPAGVPVGGRAAEEPDHRHRRPLCARSEGPSGRAAEKGDELAASHHEEFPTRLLHEYPVRWD
jgi:hypothetical protein